MTADGGGSSGQMCVGVCVTSLALAVALPCPAGENSSPATRPLPSDACRAWSHHMAELINQHRTATDLDDAQFGAVLQLFYAAQTACTAERFTEGLAMFEAIPVGPVKGKPLR